MTGGMRRFSNRLEARYKVLVIGVAGALFVAAVTGVSMAQNDSDEPVPMSAPESTVAPGAPTPPATAPGGRRLIPGFGSTPFQVTQRNGVVRNHCGLLAETPEQLSNGLMRQQDFGGFDGMVFKLPEVTEAPFYMANVPIPLATAWFDEKGSFISSTEMPLCRAEPRDCPRFRAKSRYLYAIEVPSEGLDNLGIGEGTSLQLGGTGCA